MGQGLEELRQEANDLRNQLEAARSTCADTTLVQAAASLPSLGKASIRQRRVLRGHLAKVYSFDWESQSRFIVSASQDGKLIIWNPETTNKTCAIPLRSSWVMTCAYAPSGNFVACGGLDNICTVYNLVGNEGMPRISRELSDHKGYISCCRFIDDGKIITASGDTDIFVWDIESKKKIYELKSHTSDVMSIESKPSDPNILASGSCDKTCKIWDLRTPLHCIQTFHCHTEDVNCVKFFPNGNAVATASDDSTSKLIDITSDQEIASYMFESAGKEGLCCTSVTFSSSGRLLFAGLDDCSVSIKDTFKAENVGRLAEHDNRVSCLDVSPNGNALCTGSWDSLLKLFA